MLFCRGQQWADLGRGLALLLELRKPRLGPFLLPPFGEVGVASPIPPQLGPQPSRLSFPCVSALWK